MSRPGQGGSVSVPARPVVELVLDDQGRGTVDGRPVSIDDPDDPQASLLAEAVRQAVKLSRPVRVRALDPDGVWHLVAHPDGAVTELPGDAAASPPDDPLDTGLPHLRVHPDGSITSLDDEPVDLPVTGSIPLAPPPPVAPAPTLVTPEDLAAPVAEPMAEPIDEPVEPEAVEPEPVLPEPVVMEPEPVEPEPVEPEPVEPEPVEPEPVEPEPVPAEVAEPGPAAVPQSGTPWERPLPSADPFARPTAPGATARTLPTPGDPAATWGTPDPAPAARWDADDLPGPGPDDLDAPAGAAPGAGAWLSAPTLLGGGPTASSVPRRPTPPTGAPPRPDALAVRTRPPGPAGADGRRIRPLLVAGGMAAVVVAGVATFLSAGGGDHPGPSASVGRSGASSAPPASAVQSAGAAPAPSRSVSEPSRVTPPSTLPVSPPPGFRNAPRWAMPISNLETPVLSADGRLLTLTSDDQIALLDPATGAVRWHAPVPPKAGGPHLARIDGGDVAVVQTVDRLIYWPLPAATLHPTGVVDIPAGSVSVPLPTGTQISWDGPSPLLILGNGTPAVVRNGEVQQVNLPSGMKAKAADSADVLAYSGRNWIRQGAGQAPGTPSAWVPPKGATGAAPLRVENVGGSFFATMWAGPDGPVMGVYDAHGGGIVGQLTFPKEVDFTQAPTVREIGSERTTVGSALLEPARHHLSILPSSFTPVSLTPGHIFVNDASGAVRDLQSKGADFTVVTFSGKNPIVPVGIATTGTTSVAVVVVPSGGGWLLCGLPAG